MWNWKLVEYYHFSCEKCLWWLLCLKQNFFWHYNKHFEVSNTYFCYIFFAFFTFKYGHAWLLKKVAFVKLFKISIFTTHIIKSSDISFFHFDVSLNVMRPDFGFKTIFFNSLTRFSDLIFYFCFKITIILNEKFHN